MSINLTLLKSLIKSELPGVDFYGFESVDSTSTFLKSKARDTKQAVCIANEQIEGYGQRQRSWISDKDSIKFSLLYSSNIPVSESNGLAQYIGARLCHLLNSVCCHDVLIKWPNDLFTLDGKVAGLLIESCGSFDDHSSYIVGIGINLSDLTEVVSSNYAVSFLTPKVPLEKLVVLIIQNIMSSLECFMSLQYDELCLLFSKYDYFKKGQNVFLYDSGHKITAEYEGVSSDGLVCLHIDNNKRCFHSGETSIRAK